VKVFARGSRLDHCGPNAPEGSSARVLSRPIRLAKKNAFRANQNRPSDTAGIGGHRRGDPMALLGDESGKDWEHV
jgi:hypothetical protein